MNTVFTRALVALALLTLPASALAFTKSETKPEKAKHEAKAERAKHGHSHAAVAKKEPPAKKAQPRASKVKAKQGLATAQPRPSAKAH